MSTQHPWHGEFCSKLSDAIYTPDFEKLAKLKRARAREGMDRSVLFRLVLPNGRAPPFLQLFGSIVNTLPDGEPNCQKSTARQASPDA